jgi:hypothetical protein
MTHARQRGCVKRSQRTRVQPKQAVDALGGARYVTGLRSYRYQHAHFAAHRILVLGIAQQS